MARRKQPTSDVERTTPAAPADPAPVPDEQISYSALSLHELFEQQTRQTPRWYFFTAVIQRGSKRAHAARELTQRGSQVS